jgi:hypothetical protein
MEVRGTQRIVVTLIAQPTRAQLPRDIRATSSDGSAAKIAASPEIRDLRSSRDAQPEQPVRPSVTGASPVINDGHCQVVSRWLRDLRRRRVRSGPLPNIQSGRISRMLTGSPACSVSTGRDRTAGVERRDGRNHPEWPHSFRRSPNRYSAAPRLCYLRLSLWAPCPTSVITFLPSGHGWIHAEGI